MPEKPKGFVLLQQVAYLCTKQILLLCLEPYIQETSYWVSKTRIPISSIIVKPMEASPSLATAIRHSATICATWIPRCQNLSPTYYPGSMNVMEPALKRQQNIWSKPIPIISQRISHIVSIPTFSLLSRMRCHGHPHDSQMEWKIQGILCADPVQR